MTEDLTTQKAKRILAVQLLSDTIEMYVTELESICKDDNTFITNLKYKSKRLNNLSKELRKTGDIFFKKEKEQLIFGELAEEVKKGVDNFLDIK